jgi:hypothetical protein
MAEPNFSSLIDLNAYIEKTHSGEPAYQQAKAMLEGRAKQVDVTALMSDSRAMFSGNNKPAVLFVAAVEHIQNKLVQNTDLLKKELAENQKRVRENTAEAIKGLEAIPTATEGEASSPEAEAKKASAIRTMAEATKAGIELKQYSIGLDKSTSSMTAVFDNIKAAVIKRV